MTSPLEEWLPAFAGLETEEGDLADVLRENLDPDGSGVLMVPGEWLEKIADRIKALEQQRGGATWVAPPPSPYTVGDTVRYTDLGLQVTKPPTAEAVGRVLETQDWPSRILIQWPFGLADESPEHVRAETDLERRVRELEERQAIEEAWPS